MLTRCEERIDHVVKNGFQSCQKVYYGMPQGKGQWNYQRFVWPEEIGEIFIGGYDDAGLRHGSGFCRKGNRVEPCEYKNSRRVVVTAVQ